MTSRLTLPCLLLCLLGSASAQSWQEILSQALQSDYSQTRHNGLRGIDTSTAKGLKVLWKVLENQDPDRVDWYVREGAYEALLQADSEEALKEIEKVLTGKKKEAAKEAIIFSVIWKFRKQFVKDEGGSDDDRIEDAKQRLRKTRGVEYFAMILPTIRKIDPDGRLFERIKLAFDDKTSRVRIAAITGFMAYPHKDSLPLLFGNLKALEKDKEKYYREWVMNRFALEQLTGQNFHEDVEAWLNWWENEEGGFTIERRIAEAEEDDSLQEQTLERGDIEVPLHTSVFGNKDGFPVLVLPWRQWEPDYFRPYFHGIEEEHLVYYVHMPKVGDFKGLERDPVSNLVIYPTDMLADALIEIMASANLERFAVLGHGPESSVLAMKLVAAHPEAASHLILINPRSSGERYGPVIESIIKLGKKRKSREIEKGGENILIDGETGRPIYEPSDSDEAGGLSRALQNLTFADACDPAVGQFNFLYESGDSQQTLADSEWRAAQFFQGTPRNQTLIFMGLADPWVTASDMNSVAGIFNKPRLVKMPEGGQFPFMFDTWNFNSQVVHFLRKAR